MRLEGDLKPGVDMRGKIQEENAVNDVFGLDLVNRFK